MQTRIFVSLTVFVFAIIVVGVTLLPSNTEVEQQKVALQPNELSSELNIENKLNRLESVLHQYQDKNQKHMLKSINEQVRLTKLFKDLDSRLQSIELVNYKKTTESLVSNNNSQILDTDISKNETNKKVKAPVLKESDFGHWIDDTLSEGNWDGNSSSIATEQIASSLVNIPNITLEDMQCTDQFCRATFENKNDNDQNILNLIGNPPFITDGFTINGKDGRIFVYFVQPGVSIDDSRKEAKEAMLLGLKTK